MQPSHVACNPCRPRPMFVCYVARARCLLRTSQSRPTTQQWNQAQELAWSDVDKMMKRCLIVLFGAGCGTNNLKITCFLAAHWSVQGLLCWPVGLPCGFFFHKTMISTAQPTHPWHMGVPEWCHGPAMGPCTLNSMILA